MDYRPIARLLVLTSLLSACTEDIGTFAIAVITAPESTVLDEVESVRLTVFDRSSGTATTVDAERTDDGFSLVAELPADDSVTDIRLEGFDSGGQLRAYGRTPPLPLSALDIDLTIYMAAPMSLAQAPVRLMPARSAMASTELGFGVFFAGGIAGDGSVIADVAIYNAYDHDFQIGEPLPQARAQALAMPGTAGRIYVFGGRDSDDIDSATAWSFDTTVAPAGAYTELNTQPALTRRGGNAARLANDDFVITGTPVARLQGVRNDVAAVDGSPNYPGLAAATTVDETTTVVIVGAQAGTTGAVAFDGSDFVELSGTSDVARSDHAVVTLPGGDIVALGGSVASTLVRSATRFDATTQTLTDIPDVLTTPRRNPAVAVTDDYIVVAGGRDDVGVLASVEILDASDLSTVTTLTLAIPRTEANAHALANGQIGIWGGIDGTGLPIEEIELFTPLPPE